MSGMLNLISETSPRSLPTADAAYAERYREKTVLVDILSLRDIARPTHQQKKSADSSDDEDSHLQATHASTHKRRLVKLLLSDGKRLLVGIEWHPIPFLGSLLSLQERLSEKVPSVLGRALVCRPNIQNGILFLNASSLQPLTPSTPGFSDDGSPYTLPSTLTTFAAVTYQEQPLTTEAGLSCYDIPPGLEDTSFEDLMEEDFASSPRKDHIADAFASSGFSNLCDNAGDDDTVGPSDTTSVFYGMVLQAKRQSTHNFEVVDLAEDSANNTSSMLFLQCVSALHARTFWLWASLPKLQSKGPLSIEQLCDETTGVFHVVWNLTSSRHATIGGQRVEFDGELIQWESR